MLSTQIEPRTERRTLTPRVAYAHVAAVIGLALFASGTPSPLYTTYRELWGFSPVVLTLVYATYAIGVLATLILAGRISDEVGRRPVLLVALTTLMGATVLFMVADSVIWLFVARAVQGLATGLALGAASAAMLDLHPRRDPAGVGLANGVVSAGGLGLGALVSAVLVQFAPAPRVLPYVALFALFAVAAAGALLLPEPVADRRRPRLTPQVPKVPPVVRRPFLLAALGVFVLAGSASVAQIAFGRSVPWAGAAGGSLALALGMVLIVLASNADSGALFLVGAVVGGAGFGVAFLGALRALSAAIPPAHRAEVMSAFYVVAYASLSLPAIVAGAVVTPLGLRSTFEVFGLIVAALALVVAFEAWRTRPRPQRASACPAYEAG